MQEQEVIISLVGDWDTCGAFFEALTSKPSGWATLDLGVMRTQSGRGYRIQLEIQTEAPPQISQGDKVQNSDSPQWIYFLMYNPKYKSHFSQILSSAIEQIKKTGNDPIVLLVATKGVSDVPEKAMELLHDKKSLYEWDSHDQSNVKNAITLITTGLETLEQSNRQAASALPSMELTLRVQTSSQSSNCMTTEGGLLSGFGVGSGLALTGGILLLCSNPAGHVVLAAGVFLALICLVLAAAIAISKHCCPDLAEAEAEAAGRRYTPHG